MAPRGCVLCSEPRRRMSVVATTNVSSLSSGDAMDGRSEPSISSRNSVTAAFGSVSVACCSYDMNKFGRRAVAPRGTTISGSSTTTAGGGVVPHGVTGVTGYNHVHGHGHGHEVSVIGGPGVPVTGGPTTSVSVAIGTAPTVSFLKLEGVWPDDDVVTGVVF